MSYVSCSYCGGLHKRGEICSNKPVTNKKVTKANSFRNSYRWKKKIRESILKRDRYLCQCCLRNMKGTMRQYEFDNLSVHHIEPIELREDLKSDEYNLITLCRYHHEEAEKGAISKEVLKEIVRETIEGK